MGPRTGELLAYVSCCTGSHIQNAGKSETIQPYCHLPTAFMVKHGTALCNIPCSHFGSRSQSVEGKTTFVPFHPKLRAQ